VSCLVVCGGGGGGGGVVNVVAVACGCREVNSALDYHIGCTKKESLCSKCSFSQKHLCCM
jgi:hypothetical protein